MNLDSVLRRLVTDGPAGWGERQAVRVAEEVAAARSGHVEWEPGDEEWVHVVDGRIVAQISKRFPLALVVGDDLAGVFRRTLPQVTLLPHGWSEEFDPEGFSALDLFLETA
ncbi:hypothetical protein SAMN05421812_1133 [Asanoa hainanensis]|uniref:Uncharacterized protein n=1 Tax=Asanoa hainanensis TaxID=560556 RepID=A0A239P217_9ACTN|nr:hypothetical protein [Asanoa hainanensis]SNT61115.1 hypothetical protein SAMN05421812_1133 [Asanoa hainanensis]